MSITSDIRGYADSAVEQGKQVLDQAQSKFNDAAGQANEIVGKLAGPAKTNATELTTKALEIAGELRTQVEKAVNIEAIKSAIEPYLAQARDYTTAVTDRAEALFDSIVNDKRVAKFVTTAEGVVDSVVKPVQAKAGFGTKPSTPKASTSKPATKPAAQATPKPATTRPAAKKTTARKATATPATKVTTAPTKTTATKVTATKSTTPPQA